MNKFLLFAAVFLSSCGFSNEEIPCSDKDDAFCPTGFWCRRTTCESLETSPPPMLRLIGVATNIDRDTASESDFTDTVVIDSESETVYVAITNDSKQQAAFVNYSLESACCTGFSNSDGTRLTNETIDSGELFVADITSRAFEPGCDATSFELTLVVDGRQTIGSFGLSFVEPADRNISARQCE